MDLYLTHPADLMFFNNSSGTEASSWHSLFAHSMIISPLERPPAALIGKYNKKLSNLRDRRFFKYIICIRNDRF